MIVLRSVLLLLALAGGAFAPAPARSASRATAAVTAGGVDSTLLAADVPPPPDRVPLLPEVRVVRDRALSEARRRLPTAFVVDLAPGAANRASESLSEVLAGAAGVRIVQYGGLGAFSTLSLRGASPGQVSVYVDGAPLTSAARGVVNLADLPVAAVDRVEVYRGMAPLEMGPATPGGAINLVTMAPSGLRQIALARGSFETWEGRGTVGGAAGPFAAMVHAGYQGSTGDFAFHDDNGTPFNPGDDETSTRVNNRFDAATLLAQAVYRPHPGLRVSAHEDFFHKAQGLPGLDAVPAPNPRLALERSRSGFEYDQLPGRLRPGVRVLISVDRERSRLDDAASQLGLGVHDTDDRFAGETMTLGLTSPALPLGFALRAGGTGRHERARLANAADRHPDPPESRRRTLGASAGVQWAPAGEVVTLHAARRWDRQRDELRSNGTGGVPRRDDGVRELDSPQAGVRLAPGLGVEFRANWARASRSPDFLELFGNQGSVLGNASLRPERAENWDAGVAWGRRLAGLRAGAEWAHYESRARDLIVYVRNSASTARAENVARARIRGEELSLRLAAGPVSLAGSLTWQTSIDLGDVPAWRGRRLPMRPERQAFLRADVALGPLRAAGDVQMIGENFLNRSNRERAPRRILAGASLSADAWAGVRVVLEGKNLGDQRAADVGGFPLPGRSYFASCQVRLGPGVRATHPSP